MNKESLIKARKIILKAFSESDIPLLDKLELMNNVNILLREDHYQEDMKVLKLHHKNKERGWK